MSCLQEETPEFMPPQLWPTNLPALNPVDYSVWRVLEETVYNIRIIDLNELKRQLIAECTKLDQVIIAAAIR